MVFESANGSQAPVACLRTPSGLGVDLAVADRPSSVPPTPPEAQAPPPASAPAAATPEDAAPHSHSPDWRADLTRVWRATYEWALRPRVRLTLIGDLLLLMGGVIVSNSVWTLPLMIAGALMVGIAWIGHRLQGRFTVDWGEAGTELAFNATIKAPTPPSPRRLSAPAGTSVRDVIESKAHTVEIDVSELKALIAAADAHLDEETGIRIKRVAHDD